jgi:hypothetical protein
MTTRRPKTDWVGELQALASAASPGPWLVGHADDQAYMSASYVATGSFKRSGWPPSDRVVAITFLQSPGLAMPKEAEGNAKLVAATREAVPRLCDEIERLRGRTKSMESLLQAFVSDVASKGPGRCEIHVGQDAVDAARSLLADSKAG